MRKIGPTAKPRCRPWRHAIQGAWLPLLFPYLEEFRHFSNIQAGWIATAGAIGAVVSPFLAGQLGGHVFVGHDSGDADDVAL